MAGSGSGSGGSAIGGGRVAVGKPGRNSSAAALAGNDLVAKAGGSGGRDSHGGQGPKRGPSWADVARGKRLLPSGCFELRPSNGVLKIPEELADLGLEKCKCSLIGKFLGVRPDIEAIREWAREKWAPEARVEIIALPKGYLWIKPSGRDDYNKILNGGPWFFGRRGLYLEEWRKGFNPYKHQMDIAPIWVRLPGLPINLWHEEIIAGIARGVGELVTIDPVSINGTRAVFARFNVLADLSKDLPKTIKLESKYEVWEQALVYENTTLKCSVCRQFGHQGIHCRVGAPQKMQSMNEEEGEDISPEPSFTEWKEDLETNEEMEEKEDSPKEVGTEEQAGEDGGEAGDQEVMARVEADAGNEEETFCNRTVKTTPIKGWEEAERAEKRILTRSHGRHGEREELSPTRGKPTNASLIQKEAAREIANGTQATLPFGGRGRGNKGKR